MFKRIRQAVRRWLYRHQAFRRWTCHHQWATNQTKGPIALRIQFDGGTVDTIGMVRIAVCMKCTKRTAQVISDDGKVTRLRPEVLGLAWETICRNLEYP